MGKTVMEQGGDGIRRGQARAPFDPQSRAGQTRWHRPALPSFLPGVKEKALPGVTALAPCSREEVVENKACTRLPVEGAVLE